MDAASELCKKRFSQGLSRYSTLKSHNRESYSPRTDAVGQLVEQPLSIHPVVQAVLAEEVQRVTNQSVGAGQDA